MSILCTICARGNSAGVPGKNIREINGKPLISYTIEMALKIQRFTNVIVSTDSSEIAEIARNTGADVPFMRPEEMATAKVSKFPALRHALKESEEYFKKEYKYIVDLDPTSPLRRIDDINKCIDLVEKEEVSNVITATRSRKSPYFNVIERSSTGKIKLSKEISPQPTCRQDAPECFDMNASIYAWKKSSLLDHDVPIFLESTALYEMPEERSVDIDSELDFKFVEYLIGIETK